MQQQLLLLLLLLLRETWRQQWKQEREKSLYIVRREKISWIHKIDHRPTSERSCHLWEPTDQLWSLNFSSIIRLIGNGISLFVWALFLLFSLLGQQTFYSAFRWRQILQLSSKLNSQLNAVESKFESSRHPDANLDATFRLLLAKTFVLNRCNSHKQTHNSQLKFMLYNLLAMHNQTADQRGPILLGVSHTCMVSLLERQQFPRVKIHMEETYFTYTIIWSLCLCIWEVKNWTYTLIILF